MGSKVRRRVISYFGCHDRLAPSVTIERLLANDALLAERAAVLTAREDPDTVILILSSGLVFDRLQHVNGV